METEASFHVIKPEPGLEPNIQSSLLTSASAMESPFGRIKQEEDTDTVETQAFMPAEEQVDDSSIHDQQINTTNNQPAVLVYNITAALGDIAEQVHVNTTPHHPGIDFEAGVQRADVDFDEEGDSDCEITEGEKESEKEIDDRAINNPTHQIGLAAEFRDFNLASEGLVNSDMESEPNDDETNIFIDFDDNPDVRAAEVASGSSSSGEESVIEQCVSDGLSSMGNINTTDFFDEHYLRHIIAGRPVQLTDLLCSRDTPGRGLYKLEKALDYDDHRASELQRMKRYVEAALESVDLRQALLRKALHISKTNLSKACIRNGIPDELWQEYEAFCESLEPQFGSRGGWSITCFEDHKGSYVEYDRDLALFVQSAEMPLEACNFRCEASVVKVHGKPEYVVEFWPLASPEPQAQGGNTWGEHYVSTT